jgi:hypothetical protein
MKSSGVLIIGVAVALAVVDLARPNRLLEDPDRRLLCLMAPGAGKF